MKRVKFIVASLLFCTMSYVGYTSYEKMPMSDAEKFMQVNVEALTRSEGGSEGGKSLCYNSYTKADNNQILRCVSCDYVDGIGNGKLVIVNGSFLYYNRFLCRLNHSKVEFMY